MCIQVGELWMEGGGEKIIDVEPWRDVPDLNLESWLMYKPVLTSGMVIC